MKGDTEISTSGESDLPREDNSLTQKLQEASKNTSPILLLLLGAITITIGTCFHYISVQLTYTNIGFNLDDSWIHLEYARSIYEGRAWEYSPGIPSTGSTSPLWSIILSVIFLFTLDVTAIVWGVVLISIVFYILCTFTVGHFVYSISESIAPAMVSMVCFVTVLSNTWLMLSGMEYPLFMFLLLQPLWLLDRKEFHADVLIGIIAGLTYLARPEGVLLALIVFPIRIIQHLWNKEFSKKRLLSMMMMVVAAGLVVLPWVLHCLSVSGNLLPDTFYVKVGGITDSDVEAWNIFWNNFLRYMPFLGIGFILGGLSLLLRKPYVWLMGITLALLYRFTMPYQALINNSRYLIPIFGLIMVSFIVGLVVISQRIHLRYPVYTKNDERILLAILLFLIIFLPSTILYFDQAERHGLATKNINEMQVDIGYWVAENTPEDAVLAICDVGAIRFISNRSTIDLVGLTTPDIAYGNFTGSELVQYLQSMGVDYLIIFGKWRGYFYVYMPYMLYEVYSVQLDDNLICGDDSMFVFEIIWT